MTVHVLADASGEPLAWVRAEPVVRDGPRIVLQAVDPTHRVHEHVRIAIEIGNHAAVAEALRHEIQSRNG